MYDFYIKSKKGSKMAKKVKEINNRFIDMCLSIDSAILKFGNKLF